MISIKSVVGGGVLVVALAGAAVYAVPRIANNTTQFAQTPVVKGIPITQVPTGEDATPVDNISGQRVPEVAITATATVTKVKTKPGMNQSYAEGTARDVPAAVITPGAGKKPTGVKSKATANKPAQAQGLPGEPGPRVQIEGLVQQIAGDQMVIKDKRRADGNQDVTIVISPTTRFAEIGNRTPTASELMPGEYVGVIGWPQPDHTILAWGIGIQSHPKATPTPKKPGLPKNGARKNPTLVMLVSACGTRIIVDNLCKE